MSNTATTEIGRIWTEFCKRDEYEKAEVNEQEQECWENLKSHLRALCKECGEDYKQVEELVFAYISEVEGAGFSEGFKLAIRTAVKWSGW